MNKLTRTVALIAGLVLVAGCQSSPKFSLKGSNLPGELEGKYVYLILDEDNKDSVQVSNGSFAYTSDQIDTTHLWYLVSKDAQIQAPIVRESGDFTLTRGEDGKYTITAADETNSLNSVYKNFTKEMDETLAPITQAYRAKDQELAKEGIDAEAADKLRAEMQELDKKYYEANNGLARKYYEANKDNVIGALAFSQLQFESDDDFIAAYEEASDVVKEDKNLKNHYDTIIVARETAEGKTYKGDYEISDGEGTTVKLSDYMEEGKYLLVDFWASWCGPCRMAMPHLAGIVKDHSKTINVLSVGVWEKSKEVNDAARQELGITWNTAFDKESQSTKEYGILGIPTLLLISPDGTIVYRGHSPQDVDAKIKELGLLDSAS